MMGGAGIPGATTTTATPGSGDSTTTTTTTTSSTTSTTAQQNWISQMMQSLATGAGQQPRQVSYIPLAELVLICSLSLLAAVKLKYGRNTASMRYSVNGWLLLRDPVVGLGYRKTPRRLNSLAIPRGLLS